jgi:glycosyltransferase involved in cell wall biosynthesis
MRIDLVFPVLPPTLDGIGDHTAHLARTLSAKGCDVRVCTAQEEWTSLPDVEVQQAFHRNNRRGFLPLIETVRADPPDWLVLQFEQISYGRWGLNPFVPYAIHRLQQALPSLGVAVMFHEDFMPASSLKFAIMSTWQRLQFRTLGRGADVALFSTETRAQKYKSWFPHTSVHHLPVGSNIPRAEASRAHERNRLGISRDSFVIGLFGSAHPSRLLSHVDAALCACDSILSDPHVLYIGPDGDRVHDALGADPPLTDAGPLPPEQVSRHFATMDLYLAPFRHGVSTRRGSFLVGLQHGVPTLSTHGEATGPTLARANDKACVLTPSEDRSAFEDSATQLAQDAQRRSRLSQAGPDFYETHFSWPRLAGHCLEIFDRA